LEQFDAIILGAGAAGLFCAAQASQRGRRIVVLEGSSEPARKILISGGGRCNFTNIHTSPENFLSANPHFARSALARYTPADFLALINQYRISWHEKKLGQLFCDNSARDIVNLLMTECRESNARLITSARITEVRRTAQFEVETTQAAFTAPALVVATGGLSIPKIGATSFGYDLARPFGLKVVPPRPGLVPLVFNEPERRDWCDLPGVAADVEATCAGQRFNERMLITHRGLSGPAILQISSYWDGKQPIRLDLLPDGAQLESPGNRAWKTVLALHLTKRFADRWMELHFPDGRANRHDLEATLRNWEVLPSGTEGYAKAEVTLGGVDTSELSSKTMESRKVPGLYFIGEVVDVTGHLGGYNFQWAWSSAWVAAQSL